jgi:hypothetical protein
MLRFTILKASVFGTLSVLALAAAGCSSSQGQPYSLTGNQGIHSTQGVANRASEDQQNVSHLAGWRRGINVPADYR